MYQPSSVLILHPGISSWSFYLVDCLLIKAKMQIFEERVL